MCPSFPCAFSRRICAALSGLFHLAEIHLNIRHISRVSGDDIDLSGDFVQWVRTVARYVAV